MKPALKPKTPRLAVTVTIRTDQELNLPRLRAALLEIQALKAQRPELFKSPGPKSLLPINDTTKTFG